LSVPEHDKKHIRSLLIEGRKIEAIKFIKSTYGLSLKEAKRLIDLVDLTIGPNEYAQTISSKPAKNVEKIVASVFLVTGILMLFIAVFIFMKNEEFISRGITGRAVVISNPAKPVFEYEYQGVTHQYQTNTESNPPSYAIGEEVDIFIDPDNPDNILVDTFLDRWLAILIVGSLGAVFFLAGLFTFFYVNRSNIAKQRVL
jgi:hypothetical protein